MWPFTSNGTESNGLAGALTQAEFELRVIVKGVAEWRGVGSTHGELPWRAVKEYVQEQQKPKAKGLRGPSPDGGRTKGSPCHMSAVVRVARLLSDNGRMHRSLRWWMTSASRPRWS